MRAIISTLLRLCFSHMSSTNASKLAVLFRNPPKLITFEVTLSPRHRREGWRGRLMGPAFYGNRVTRTGVHIKGFLIRLPYWKFSELRPKLKPVEFESGQAGVLCASHQCVSPLKESKRQLGTGCAVQSRMSASA